MKLTRRSFLAACAVACGVAAVGDVPPSQQWYTNLRFPAVAKNDYHDLRSMFEQLGYRCVSETIQDGWINARLAK